MVYLHADFASPLAWDIDHWFPCASKESLRSDYCFSLLLLVFLFRLEHSY
jgi:hypothetical protein